MAGFICSARPMRASGRQFFCLDMRMSDLRLKSGQCRPCPLTWPARSGGYFFILFELAWFIDRARPMRASGLQFYWLGLFVVRARWVHRAYNFFVWICVCQIYDWNRTNVGHVPWRGWRDQVAIFFILFELAWFIDRARPMRASGLQFY